MNFQEGEIICINKPLRWTSFDVVNKVRWLLCRHLGVKKLKVGHAGTLDPLATGVMLICTGRATKHIDELQAQTKEYVATVQLGATTPSFDLEQPVDAVYPASHITKEMVEQMLPRFLGRIEQVPPAYSAVKVDGDRAYDLARRGHDIELKPKVLIIDEIELMEWQPTSTPSPVGRGEREWGKSEISIPRTGMRRKAFLTAPINAPTEAFGPAFTVRVVCSKGTYIRALARDFGEALGTGAHLTALRRTRVGDYSINQAITIEQFTGLLSPTPAPGRVE